MKTILDLAIKDLKLVRRDLLGLFFIIGLPILMGLFFGIVGASTNSPSSSSSNAIPIATIDEDQSVASKRFLELLAEQDQLQLDTMDKAEALDEVRRGQRTAVIVIPAGFNESAGIMWANDPPTLQIASDPSKQAVSAMLEGYVMQAMGQLTMEKFQDVDSMRPLIDDSRKSIQESDELSVTEKFLLTQVFNSLDGLFDSLESVQESEEEPDDTGVVGGPNFQLANLESLPLKQPDPDEEKPLVSKVRTAWDISFPAAILWGVLGCSAGFAVSIVRERTHGTLLRLKIAPLTRSQLLLGKAAACFIAVLGVVTLLTTLAVVLGMRPQNYPMLVVAAICVAICFVGVMMTLSVIGRTEEAVSGASWGFNVVAAMLGGGMIPLAFMPGFLQPLSNLSPVKWGVLALEGAIWREFSWMELATPCLILLGIGAVGFSIGCVVLSRD